MSYTCLIDEAKKSLAYQSVEYASDWAEKAYEVAETKRSMHGLSSLTVAVPVVYENCLLELLPSLFTAINEVREEGKYFLVNGKKLKKLTLFEMLMTPETISSLDLNGTTGKLWLTVDPLWFYRATWTNEWINAQSCFKPTGQHHASCWANMLSLNYMLAMVTDSEMTKVIGRRWIILPHTDDGGLAQVALFLRRYGDLNMAHQRSMSDWICTNIFHKDKKDCRIVDSGQELGDVEKSIYIPCYNSGYGSYKKDHDSDTYFGNWWTDNSNVIVTGEKDIPDVMLLSTAFYDDSANSDEDEDEDDRDCCEYCGERYDSDDLYWVGPDGNDRVCRLCRDVHYTYCDLVDEYWRNNRVYEVWNGSEEPQFVPDIEETYPVILLDINDMSDEEIDELALQITNGYHMNGRLPGQIVETESVSDYLDNISHYYCASTHVAFACVDRYMSYNRSDTKILLEAIQRVKARSEHEEAN